MGLAGVCVTIFSLPRPRGLQMQMQIQGERDHRRELNSLPEVYWLHKCTQLKSYKFFVGYLYLILFF
jgi:hypothetical protein